ncbi:MAG: hypothetical protein QF830_03870 [Rhodospirillales bacterium]|nr:hypothetical protein [Rhodospirillales bacterium]MDP6883254.1 hypothetical protein [Rhodospirillales bacterium]
MDRNTLKPIPFVEDTGASRLALIEEFPEHLAGIMDQARRHYGGLALRLGDGLSRRWLARSRNPYRDEIADIAGRVGRPGMVLLNLSYEWTCTSGVAGARHGDGSRLLRTLDWRLDGLGRSVVVAARQGPAGPFHDVTWPGFVGVATAMAPGRFSAAINQPPMRVFSPSFHLDWVLNRARVWRRPGLPPTHLLRRVFDDCPTFGEAKAALTETPLCLPAFFILSGIEADQGCVIERLEDQAHVHEAPASIANQWLDFSVRGRGRGGDNQARRDAMADLGGQADDDFSWVAPPILNPTTRISVIANAREESLVVQGWEAGAPATQVFTL